MIEFTLMLAMHIDHYDSLAKLTLDSQCVAKIDKQNRPLYLAVERCIRKEMGYNPSQWGWLVDPDLCWNIAFGYWRELAGFPCIEEVDQLPVAEWFDPAGRIVNEEQRDLLRDANKAPTVYQRRKAANVLRHALGAEYYRMVLR